jgi:hypothetical protein
LGLSKKKSKPFFRKVPATTFMICAEYGVRAVTIRELEELLKQWNVEHNDV